MTFKARLKSKEFMVALTKRPPQKIAKMLLKAQKYMNAKNAVAAIRDDEKPREGEEKGEDLKGRKREKGDRQGTNKNKRRDNKTPRMVKFTPLVMLVDKILMQIKDEHHHKWPRPLHSSPNVRDKKKYCLFHKEHGHYTEDCRDLKEQIEELIRKGKLQKFVKNKESRKSRSDNKEKHEVVPRDEDNTFNHAQNAIGEIKMITEGPSIGGSFISLKKSQ